MKSKKFIFLEKCAANEGGKGLNDIIRGCDLIFEMIKLL
jgi:hypothetical protein